jgi:crossover junction endodeoxyribonuclease RuvC
MSASSHIILGIDPGSIIMGYAIVTANGNTIELLKMDVLKLAAYKDAYQRLEIIHSAVCNLIQTHRPTMFAIEAPFFGKNVQSMLKLGRAQGVAIAAAMQAAIPVTEYSPKKIKQSVTGNGNATKEQVFKMLQHIIQFEEKPHFFDATDALAVALCHHYSTSSPVNSSKKTVKGWKDFIAQNPGRTKTPSAP